MTPIRVLTTVLTKSPDPPISNPEPLQIPYRTHDRARTPKQQILQNSCELIFNSKNQIKKTTYTLRNKNFRTQVALLNVSRTSHSAQTAEVQDEDADAQATEEMTHQLDASKVLASGFTV